MDRRSPKTASAWPIRSDVRQAIPDAEAYYADNGSYTGMDTSALKGYDSGMQLYSSSPANPGILTVAVDTTGTSYCISAEDNGQFAYVAGPGGKVQAKQSTDVCAGTWTAPS